ncbi:hypothetical protein KP509_30G035100 [Ceratopteris richardii]|uniref:Uncharacterized protein n=1 Tax=Ceratopteris richardii TaxID=49495 RepID=A0A8T2R2E2_CERRI|nr:hypothetical protein KP509_30G035100 [Ceratopteris richardii]KAH7290177.1 hypothetical protein KP509_30G035100 [Ceratopteris richardii]KAH7290178.1 hypothetical protein KP509_30G035100 [Ceratopteris richardii]
MDPFALGLLAPPARSVKLSAEAYLLTDHNQLAPHFLEDLESQLEQAKEKTLRLRAQEQQRDKPPPRENKIASESRYWTNEERQRFEKALKTFGTDFVAIAKFVGTRSSTQVRTHAQKYYAKLIRDYKRSGKAQGGTKESKMVMKNPPSIQY